ncbi:SDR family oxidoreductase [bacterium]|jgi:3(or 17)beta-hydroxysteroid dehydrogenase|nr:SDR family oxidoreductase [bacterium]
MGRLEGKIALITGSLQGIGLASAQIMEQQGATVILSDICDQKSEEVLRSFKNSRYIHLDVSHEQDWMSAKSYILTKFGRLDVLVNNAGITGFQEDWGPQDPENVSLEAWKKVHAVNQDGVFLGCKYGIELMKQHGGSIINISSRSGVVGIPGAAAYASSKASVRNHTKTVAIYCAEKGYRIRCNSIHPATVITPMWDPFLGQGEQRKASIKALESQIPLGIVGVPEDVAHAVVYLASEESRYLTGTELHLDGGLLAGSAATPARKE